MDLKNEGMFCIQMIQIQPVVSLFIWERINYLMNVTCAVRYTASTLNCFLISKV